MKAATTILLTIMFFVTGCGGGNIQDCECDECVCSCSVVQVGTPEVL